MCLLETDGRPLRYLTKFLNTHHETICHRFKRLLPRRTTNAPAPKTITRMLTLDLPLTRLRRMSPGDNRVPCRTVLSPVVPRTAESTIVNHLPSICTLTPCTRSKANLDQIRAPPIPVLSTTLHTRILPTALARQQDPMRPTSLPSVKEGSIPIGGRRLEWDMVGHRRSREGRERMK